VQLPAHTVQTVTGKTATGAVVSLLRGGIYIHDES
jgi:hypothetical protein